jgi:hypothetical protein
MMSEKTLTIVRILLFLGMTLCFSFQILDSFKKYLAGKSSMTEALVPLEQDDPLPSFSICSHPAFDGKFMEENLNISSKTFYPTSSLSDINHVVTFPENLSTIPNNLEFSLNKFWKDSTISPDAIAVGNDYIIDDFLFNEDNENNETEEVQSINVFNSLWYGKCTSIVLKTPRSANELLNVIIGYFSVLLLL